MQSFSNKTKDGLKRELGVVYYCNIRLILPPKDIVLEQGREDTGSEWTKCFPFVKNVSRFILRDVFQHFALPPEFKKYARHIVTELLKEQRAEVKDYATGRWLQIWISPSEGVLEYWPPDYKTIHKGLIHG